MNEEKLLKLEIDDEKNLSEEPFCIEYNLITSSNVSDLKNENLKAIKEIDNEIQEIDDLIERLNDEIDILTNNADTSEYVVAVASGVLSGLVDSFFVKDYSPDISKLVISFAEKKSHRKFDNYEDAQAFLEKNFHTPNDSAYQKGHSIFGKEINVGGRTHRLDDIAHHPSVYGLISSIFIQFIRLGLFANKDGKWRWVFVKTDIKDIIKAWGPAVLTGLLHWLVNIADSKYEEEFGMKLPKPIRVLSRTIASLPLIYDILKCADLWISHIMSDINTPAGIPGIILTFFKEFSMLPIVKNTRLPATVQRLYANKELNFDKDLVLLNKLGKQSIPIIMNEIIVRGFYFIHNLSKEYKLNNNSLDDVDWGKIIPVGNRIIIRMLTISTTTFTAFDIADAAIRSGGFNQACILRINIVGVGRFAIAIVTDAAMGIKKNIKTAEVIAYQGIEMKLLNAKVYYGLSNVWIAARDATEAIDKARASCENMLMQEKQLLHKVVEYSDDIKTGAEAIRENDPELAAEMLKIIGN